MKKLPLVIALVCGAMSAAFAAFCPGPGFVMGNPPTGFATCHFYVAATGGSDANSGTIGAPFATLAHAQVAMQGVTAANKVTCLKAGTYSLTSALTLGSADSGETWQSDPASGVNTAVIDGGGSTNTAFSGSSATNVTINGVKIQHFATSEISGANSATGWTVENSDLGQGGTGGGVGVGASNVIAMAKGWTVKSNYVHDWANGGITFWAFNAGDSTDGAVIDRNVVLNTCTTENDCGAIYGNMRNNPPGAGTVSHVTVSNNFVRDYGSVASQTNAHCIYLDDDASNVTMTSNICGPPVSGDTARNSMSVVIYNGGDGNILSNNILDEGLTSTDPILSMGPCGQGGTISCTAPTAANQISKNIIVMNYTGSFSGNIFGNGGAFPWTSYYCSAAGAFPGTVAGWVNPFSTNMYHNYGTGTNDRGFGSTLCGTVLTETTPQVSDPICSGYLYALAGNSPALAAPMNFVDVAAARSAGPPGFVIPTSTNHSC